MDPKHSIIKGLHHFFPYPVILGSEKCYLLITSAALQITSTMNPDQTTSKEQADVGP